jgi:hypothetical protein
MKRTLAALGAALLSGLLLAPPVRAQEESLSLTLTRDWGYGGFGGDIQGTFSFRVRGPNDLERVEFYIDETMIGEVTQAPFDLQFVTDDYPVGDHELYAVGHTARGTVLRSNSAFRTFVSAAEGGKAALNFLIPLFAVIFGAMGLAAVVSLLAGRRAARSGAGVRRSYTFGGGICPKCRRPFGLHLLAPNMLVGKFDHCPYCGRWGIVRLASDAQLRAAEQAEAESVPEQAPEESPEEKFKKELEDSKYQGL